MVGNVAFATKRVSEKYTVMCHEIDLLLMTTNGAHMTSAFSSATLASRESVAKTPIFQKPFSCLAVIMGETGGSGCNPGLNDRQKDREI